MQRTNEELKLDVQALYDEIASRIQPMVKQVLKKCSTLEVFICGMGCIDFYEKKSGNAVYGRDEYLPCMAELFEYIVYWESIFQFEICPSMKIYSDGRIVTDW
jgi:hypothetical protein